jgi:Fic family protein
MIGKIENEILEHIKHENEISSKQLFEHISKANKTSYATLKRILAKLVSDHLISVKGTGKSTKYILSKTFELLKPIDINLYFEKEIDEREIKENFNLDLLTELSKIESIFTTNEIESLTQLQNQFQQNISDISPIDYTKELERLAIDLSWKSSQIEGNTYSLLETERLLKEKETAAGKTKEEAVMLLNHKEAIDFIIENKDYLIPLSVSKIEDLHRLLIKELGVEKNIRKRRVGISGTNYKPLDNEFQIVEAVGSMCDLVNSRSNVFEKALLTLVFISYIQPFSDGNKRTARIVSNAILMNYNYCPISFRTVDSIDYKKAMLLFYEQNNISKFKEIFIEQFRFAVNTYF